MPCTGLSGGILVGVLNTLCTCLIKCFCVSSFINYRTIVGILVLLLMFWFICFSLFIQVVVEALLGAFHEFLDLLNF